MTISILAVGDVVGQTGIAFLKEHLKTLQKEKGISFTVVNGENANVVGITPAQADAILNAGADVITLGNHTWSCSPIWTKRHGSSVRPTTRPSAPAGGTPPFPHPSAPSGSSI